MLVHTALHWMVRGACDALFGAAAWLHRTGLDRIEMQRKDSLASLFPGVRSASSFTLID